MDYRFPDMFTTVGVAKSAGVTTALLVGVSVIPTIFLQWRGRTWGPKKETAVSTV